MSESGEREAAVDHGKRLKRCGQPNACMGTLCPTCGCCCHCKHADDCGCTSDATCGCPSWFASQRTTAVFPHPDPAATGASEEG